MITRPQHVLQALSGQVKLRFGCIEMRTELLSPVGLNILKEPEVRITLSRSLFSHLVNECRVDLSFE